MNRDHLPPTPDDALLKRYREANELDAARPGPALRENVLAHARAVAASRLETPPPNARPAANDSTWTWRALGSLAVIGLVGLLVLQFDRGTPEEQELALGAGSARPAAETAAAPAAPAAPAQPAESAAPQAQPPLPASPQQKLASEAQTQFMKRPPAPTATAPEAADRMAGAEPAQEAERAAPADSAEVAPPPQAPAAAVAPAPASKAMAPQAPAPMPRAAPAATAPVPATADSAASAGISRNATEGVLRERREISSARPAPPPSPLFAAIASGNADAVRQRLAEGADPNTPDATGRTPLIAAVRTGNEAVVRLLLAAGADRTLRDREGLNAADHAEQSGHPGLLPLLR